MVLIYKSLTEEEKNKYGCMKYLAKARRFYLFLFQNRKYVNKI